MALGGNEVDLAVRQYNGIAEHELQQETSVLMPHVTIEAGLMGERSYFDRFGASNNVVQLTDRFDPLVPNRFSAERRLIAPIPLHDNVAVSELDIIRMANNVDGEMARSVAMALERAEDALILQFMAGTAGRELLGSASNVAFDSANTLAVNSGASLASVAVSGDTQLHEGKIRAALQILSQNQVDLGREPIVAIGSSRALAAFKARCALVGSLRRDFLDTTPLKIAGLDRSLSGIEGIEYVRYEPLSDVVNNGDGTDEYVYIMAKSAIKVGFWKPRQAKTFINDMNYRDRPVIIRMDEVMGGVRMDEKKIVRILCDV